MLKLTYIIFNTKLFKMIQLCSQDEISEGLAKGFLIGERNIFAIKKNDIIFAYENKCPHLNIELEWLEDQFLDSEKNFIICSTHGALFKIEDGLCISGPCEGQTLTPIEIKVDSGKVYILN